MTGVNLRRTLEDLDRVFHHEADFQHALAWHIHQRHPEAKIRLERRFDGIDFPGPAGDVYVDISIREGGASIPLELKYKPNVFGGDWGDESFELRRHSAGPVSRFDFVDDIARIETVIGASNAEHGAVVLLTNDHLYWQPPTQDDVVDHEFRLHEGKTLEGELNWSENVSTGTTTQKRNRPIRLKGIYELGWRDYEYEIPSNPEQNARFRYLFIEIGQGL